MKNYVIVGPTTVAYLDVDGITHKTSRGYAIAWKEKLPSGDTVWTCDATSGYGSASDPETAVACAGMDGTEAAGFRTRREAHAAVRAAEYHSIDL